MSYLFARLENGNFTGFFVRWRANFKFLVNFAKIIANFYDCDAKSTFVIAKKHIFTALLNNFPAKNSNKGWLTPALILKFQASNAFYAKTCCVQGWQK